MSDLMDEIGEDLRQQQLKAFWKENGAWIIGGVILAIVATAGMSFWREYQLQKNLDATSAFLTVVNQADAEKISAFADTTDKNHAATAQFIAAGLLLQQGKKDEAATLYAKIEKLSGLDSVYRDLATLYGVRIALDKGGDAAPLQMTLEKLSSKKSAWRYSALETQALLFARDGKSEEAIKLLDQISADPEAPADARTRAFTLRELYQGTVTKESN